MTHAGFLGLQVPLIVRIWLYGDGQLLIHLEAITFQAYHLFGVVGEKPDGLEPVSYTHLTLPTKA